MVACCYNYLRATATIEMAMGEDMGTMSYTPDTMGACRWPA